MPKKSPADQPAAAFQFTQSRFQDLVAETLQQAKALGAGDAVADRNAQAIGLGDFRNGVACAQSFRLLQSFCDQVVKAALGELKGGGGLIGR